MKDFEELLRNNGLRVTEPRRQVFTILSKTHEPLSLSDIYKQCQHVDRASVYRTIDTCARIGIIKVVYIGWKKLYELTDLFSPHHHHLRCTSCLSMSHISDPALEQAIEDVAHKQRFILTAHHFEIEGICRACQVKLAVS